jgi:predicted kinase
VNKPLGEFVRENLKDGFLMISCGLPGTGKSTAIEAVHKIRGGKLLKSDIIRREALKGEDVFDAKVAGDMNKRTRVYDLMFQQAGELIKQEKNVYLDATFITKALRQQAAAIADKHRTSFIILETVCPEAVALERILRRDKATSLSNAVTEEAYRSNQKRYEPVDLDGLKKLYPALKMEHITVDTGRRPSFVVKDEKR